jgi:FkbM family methyltransferase
MVYQNLCEFLKNDIINIIFEIGARDCADTPIFLKYFKNVQIFCYECNPEQINICMSNINKINNNNIFFNDYGLGEVESNKNFYPYVAENIGCSSFLKRIDFDDTQKEINMIKISTVKNEIIKYNIKNIDLLFMDVQGYELNILKGCFDYIIKIKYIFLEIPKENINRNYLKEGHSKYIGAPTRNEIIDYLYKNNFVIIKLFPENELEENILFENKFF